jgi:diacylglycerol kinase family enzyme
MAAVTPPSAADQVLISVSPQAGRRSSRHVSDRLVDLLRARRLVPEVSSDLQHVAQRANQLHAEGRLKAVVGIGGDGTAAELINRTEPGVPITLLAAGTANLISRHFRLSGSPERVAATIAEGKAIRLDAGLASGRLFMVVASCGLDAEVVRRVHERRRNNPAGGHIGYRSYGKPIIDSLRTYRYPEMRIDWEGLQEGACPPSPLRARWAFAFNIPRYGWGLPLAPAADATDGLIDVCTFRRGSLWHGLRYLAAAQLGWHRWLDDCVCCRARRLRITADEQVPYQLDGDPGGMLPVEIEVLPGRVSLIVPAESASPEGGGKR